LHIWGRGDVHAEIWWGMLKERGQLGKPSHRWKDNTKTDLKGVR